MSYRIATTDDPLIERVYLLDDNPQPCKCDPEYRPITVAGMKEEFHSPSDADKQKEFCEKKGLQPRTQPQQLQQKLFKKKEPREKQQDIILDWY